MQSHPLARSTVPRVGTPWFPPPPGKPPTPWSPEPRFGQGAAGRSPPPSARLLSPCQGRRWEKANKKKKKSILARDLFWKSECGGRNGAEIKAAPERGEVCVWGEEPLLLFPGPKQPNKQTAPAANSRGARGRWGGLLRRGCGAGERRSPPRRPRRSRIPAGRGLAPAGAVTPKRGAGWLRAV